MLSLRVQIVAHAAVGAIQLGVHAVLGYKGLGIAALDVLVVLPQGGRVAPIAAGQLFSSEKELLRHPFSIPISSTLIPPQPECD